MYTKIVLNLTTFEDYFFTTTIKYINKNYRKALKYKGYIHNFEPHFGPTFCNLFIKKAFLLLLKRINIQKCRNLVLLYTNSCIMAAPVRLELTTHGLTVRAPHAKTGVFDRKIVIFAPFSHVRIVQSQFGPNFYGLTFLHKSYN